VKTFFKKILAKFNFSIRRKINNHYFKIPILGSLGVSNLFFHELWMIDLLNKINNIGIVKFIDVGANVGQTLLMVKSVDNSIDYVGFEPNQNCIFYLRKLITQNLFTNVMLIPVGISTKTRLEELNFYSESEVDPSASVIADFRKKGLIKKALVPLFNVNDLNINFDGISILKIDVEGGELEVIESFYEIIKGNNPIILIEILPVYSPLENPERLQRQNKIEELLKVLDYSIFRINQNKNQFFGITKINEIGIHSNLNHCDYVVVPSTKLTKFLECLKT
jgi:FkbM family methyltransferase